MTPRQIGPSDPSSNRPQWPLVLVNSQALEEPMRFAESRRPAFSRLSIALWAFVLTAYGLPLSAQDGLTPYTPTTVEWFSLWGHARLGGDRGSHSIIVSPRPPNTIRVSVAYFNIGAREAARRSLEHVVHELRAEANFRGWHWLTIEEALQDRSR